MNDLNQRIARLSPEKRALLALQLMKKSASVPHEQEITPLPRNDGTVSFPLSFSQQRLWFLDRFQPDSPLYNIPSATRLRGSLDVAALQTSLGEIVKRHESLRTTFASVDDQPVQIIAQTMNLLLPVTDLSELPESERETRAQRLVAEEAGRPFDLAQGPLLRTGLLRLGEDEHILLLTVHHIISDGWSMGVLFRELKTLYAGYINEQPALLAALPVQYADFAGWQRAWLQGEALEKQLAYWRRQLVGDLPVLELQTDRPRPAVLTYNGDMLSVTLGQPLTAAIKAVSRREGCTLFMTLLAAFQVLLHRYTGQDDILIGTPIAGRGRSEIEGLIGFFINTLVLRTDLSGDPTFKDLLGRVREVALAAYTHQDLPFEKLVEELQPERNMSHAPLFQVMLALHNTPPQALELAGLEPGPLRIERRTAKFDISLDVVEVAHGLRMQFEYNTDLFDPATIARMQQSFQTLLEGIAMDPERRISILPLLSVADCHQQLVEWNEVYANCPHDRYVHQLFEAQVEQTPEAIALAFKDLQLSYRELNQRANQLAHHLRSLGVGPEILVAVCIRRSLEMVVALLAILKAGGVYVPLDPDYPRDRLVFMLEDIDSPVIIVESSIEERLPEHHARCVFIDRPEMFGQCPVTNPATNLTLENLAYVIYTSGSTGTPKGVTVPHQALAGHCIDCRMQYELGPSDRVLQFASFSFDASLEQILTTLVSGAMLVVRGNEILSPRQFYHTIAESKLTVIDIPPSYWHQLALAGIDAVLAGNSLRLVIVGGEEMLPNTLQLWLRSSLRDVRLLNAYGPTEATITALTFEMPPRYKEDASVLRIPIGRPCGGRKIYILDSHRQPVPIGVAGELHIGGARLARGYLNRPELTAEKFIRDPFSADPDARAYKTGDLARYLPDGNIEFLGRLDQQIKLRGFRIEPGEIEAALARHPEVREALVTLREDTPGDKRLVAYIVQAHAGSASPVVQELRIFLKGKLPDYMVPAAIVMLDSLPLTSSGKVDRQALPAPDLMSVGQVEYLAPRTSLELQLSKIWGKILKLPTVGVTDNFFDMGGHSLLAVRLVAHIEKTLGKNLPLATFFQAPTIEQLAVILCKEGWAPSWASLVPIQAGGSQPPFFCVHGGGGALLHFRDLVRHLGPDQPFYGLQPQGIDGRQEPLRRVEAMASLYINEIRALQPDGPYYLGGHCFGGLVALEIAQQFHAQGQQVGLLVLIDTSSPRSVTGHTAQKSDLLSRLQERLRLHWGNLSLLGREEKLTYLFSRAQRKSKSTIMRMAYKVYLCTGTVMPHTLRNKYIFDVNVTAQKAYLPTVYAGQITLFRASQDIARRHHHRYQEGWNRLAAGGLEYYDLPASHTTLFREPQVKYLAKQLAQCIRDAPQSADSGKAAARDNKTP